MSTEPIWQTESTSLEDTLLLAARVGSKLRGGEFIELVSDLGGGKTAFVKGLARGLGSNDNVHSPSFTLSNQYKGEKFTLYHFDFYRLKEPGILQAEIGELIGQLDSVVIVEWGNIIEDVLPSKRLTIRITPTGENARRFEFYFPEELNYFSPGST